VEKTAISKHAKNIFESGELEKRSTVSKMETVQKEGGRAIKKVKVNMAEESAADQEG
jgi:hypothetical protein